MAIVTKIHKSKLRREADALQAQIDRLEQQRDRVMTRLRSSCRHLMVVEVDYHAGSYLTQPPRRICLHCGVEEEGWGCGYKVLKDATGRVVQEIESRDEFYRLRMPGPLCEVGNSLLRNGRSES